MYPRISSSSPTHHYVLGKQEDVHDYSFRKKLSLQKDHTTVLFSFKQRIRLQEHTGLTLIILTDDPQDPSRYQAHLLSGTIYLEAGIFFNTLAVTEEACVLLEAPHKEYPKSVSAYKLLNVRTYEPQIKLNKLYAFGHQLLQTKETRYIAENNYYEILFIDAGNLTIDVGEIEFTLTENQAFILPPLTSHDCVITANKHTSIISAYFNAEGLEKAHLLQVLNLNPLQNRYVEAILRKVEEGPNVPFINDLISAYFLSLLVSFYVKEDQPIQEAQTSMRDNYEDELFRSIIEYIDEHVEEKNEVQDLVDHFDVSRSTLQMLFNKYIQMTPKQYINHIRLTRSKRLIRETTYSLSEIADILGYGSIQYFSRAFKREFGSSPSAYAKSILN